MGWRNVIVAAVLLIGVQGFGRGGPWAAASTGGVVIGEIQLGGPATGQSGYEFIELHNSAPGTVALDKWTLQYRAASAGADCAKGWVTKAAFGASHALAPHGFVLAAATGYLEAADIRFTAGMAATGGAVRLLDAQGEQMDAVAWGTASCGEGTALAVAPDGSSYERRPGSAVPSGGNGEDADDNARDFSVRTAPEPQSASSAAEGPLATFPEATPVPTPGPEIRPVISEVFPDPTAPLSDAADEFIELANPAGEELRIEGYALRVGTRTFALPPAVLSGHGHLVVGVTVSKLTLTNAGGEAVLSDGEGTVVDRTVWAAAVPGASWSLVGDSWQWTTMVTPGEPNVADVPDEGGGADTEPEAVPSIAVTEVLPDPGPLLTDGIDEFVELRNDGTVPVDLEGYALRSGSSLGNKAVLTGVTIDPGEHLALPAALTHLPLANGGGRVALTTPGGTIVGQPVAYPPAGPGQSYAAFGGTWAWTLLPTPGAANVLLSPLPAVKSAAKAAPKAKASPKPTKTPSAKKAAAAKTPKPKATPRPTPKPLLVTAQSPPSARWLLFVLGGLTIGYIAYEFRYDLQNHLYRARRYLGSRGGAGPAPPGRERPGAQE